ncbi:MAG TPA: class I SAM-dependent methyltransferase [Solirubrobacteraceae bacterium]|jgi:SAM-dependent methyltransferase|nr:class I SAM-dependent methyltransferase [Solirubrobacteraceae bacterium]
MTGLAHDALARPAAGSAPRCLWCGAPARPLGETRLAVCDACGAASTHPPPDDRELGDAYAGWYRPATGRFGSGGDQLLRRSRAVLARRLDRRAPPGPVLDVGCGEGALLDALHARGREALGLERGAVAARPDVRSLEVTAFEEREGQWAAVVFWHSLEHLRDPAAAIDRACALLAPGGLLVIAVPNRESWQARWFGERWFALDLPRHLLHLPASALIAGLRHRGLELERVSQWRGGQVVFGWLQGLVGTLPRRPDLYDAIRRPEGRRRPLSPRRRAATLTAGMALAPLAFVLAAAEMGAGVAGTIYVEARKGQR